MKKLMIAACAVAFAMAVQATTYKWDNKGATVFNGYDSTAAIGTAWTGATATGGLSWYLICADSYSQGDILTKFRNGTKDFESFALNSGTTTTAGIPQTETWTADSSLVREDGKMYAFYAILSDDSSMLYLNDASGVTANTIGGVATLSPALGLSTKKLQDKDGTHSYGSAGWYGAAVPEPTSGLLLLLGVAGLALRRRRA